MSVPGEPALPAVRVLLYAPLDADTGNWHRVRRFAPDIVSVIRAPLASPREEGGELRTVALIHRSSGREAIEAAATSVGGSGGVIVVGDEAETVDETVAALAAGAHGYLGTSRPVEQFVTAIRAVAAGYLFAPVSHLPSIAKRVLDVAPEGRPQAEASELTRRELDVLTTMARGYSNAEIGKHLFISESTVRSHVLAILRKFGARNRTEAVILANQRGILLDKR